MNAQPPVTDPEAHDAHLHELDTGRTNLMLLIAMILVSVGLAAVAQLTLKQGMTQVTETTGPVGMSTSSLRAIVTNVYVIGGLAIFGVSAFVWLIVLSKASLSFAYPFASLSYLLIVLADKYVLHEAIPPLRWAGVACIMAGIILVAQTPHR